MIKIQALTKHLECFDDELTESKYDENSFEYGREEYLVLTDDEADAMAKERVLESVYAFKPEFLAAHSDLDSKDFESIQANDRYEDNNRFILKLLNDLDHFVDDAIKCDGRGHFISNYDGEENEVRWKDSKGDYHHYFIYRTN